MALNFANNNSLSAITTKPSGLSGGALNLISTQTASSSATISFTSGIDDTYDSYVFKFYDIHASIDAINFTFQADTGTNTSYNQTITSTIFQAYNNEAGGSTGLDYLASHDQAQGTAFQNLTVNTGNGNDESVSGYLEIYNPSSTVFVKHFIARINSYNANDFSSDYYTAGYFNLITANDGTASNIQNIELVSLSYFISLIL